MKSYKLVFVLLFTITVMISVASDALQQSRGVVRSKEKEATQAPNQTQSFEALPPIASQMFVKKLNTPDIDGNTILLMAQFPKTETRLKGPSALTIRLDDNRRVVFADNGENGDEKANDDIFSARLKINDQDFIRLINRNNEIIQRKNSRETIFIARSAVQRRLSPFDINGFRAGRRIPFDLAFTSVVDATTLPAIRNKSLMITDISVVEDPTRTYDPCKSPKGNPNGPWSFHTLIANMANTPLTGVTPKQFLIDWVDVFLFNSHTLSTSGDATTNRLQSKERLIKAWIKNSGLPVPSGSGVPPGWQTLALKAEDFPVRLLAIVNRLDLRGNSGYGGFSNAGEGRFVFCFIDSNVGCTNPSNDGNNGPGTMTFILEYAIPISNCVALKNYATQWWDLRGTAFGSTFNSTLESITNVFTAANAMASKPNKSALNHLRTNDFIQSPWDIRDFEISVATNKLKIVHPNKEPMESANGNSSVPNIPKLTSLVSFVNGLPFSSTPNPVYTIPPSLAGIQAPMSGPGFHWRGNTANVMTPLNRREFSLSTCSGCHTRETRNFFTHVRPRDLGAAAALSGFMTGLGADDESTDIDTDPVGRFFVSDPGPTPLTAKKAFNEAFDRAVSLETLIFNSPCTTRPQFPQDIQALIAIHQILNFQPKNSPH